MLRSPCAAYLASMERVWILISLSSAIFLSTGAHADDSLHGSIATKRQIFSCMTKRMSNDRTISYNDAEKTCKQSSPARKDTLAVNAPVKTAVKTP